MRNTFALVLDGFCFSTFHLLVPKISSNSSCPPHRHQAEGSSKLQVCSIPVQLNFRFPPRAPHELHLPVSSSHRLTAQQTKPNPLHHINSEPHFRLRGNQSRRRIIIKIKSPSRANFDRLNSPYSRAFHCSPIMRLFKRISLAISSCAALLRGSQSAFSFRFICLLVRPPSTALCFLALFAQRPSCVRYCAVLRES